MVLKIQKRERCQLILVMDPKVREELLTHHHGGSKVDEEVVTTHQ